MRKTYLITVFFCLMLLMKSGCGTTSMPGMLLDKDSPQKTQLEIRQMQTRTYQTKDKTLVMKAMLNVLQDDDYIIEQVNMDLGFFNAQKEVDVEDSGEKFWQTFWWGKAYATYKKNQIIDATANISEFGDEMRVRVNFRVKVINNKGGVEIVRQIDNPEYYQKFFSKVDKGIFIEKEQI